MKVLSSLLTHKEFLVNIHDIISDEYFENSAQKWAIKEILKYYDHLDQEIITVAVYEFLDQTGQRKPSPKFSQLSMAVSQGSANWVIQALKETGEGTWFRVVEREGLDNLVK